MTVLTYLFNEHALEDFFSTMPLWILLLTIALTIFVLSKGADFMIDGAVHLALRTKLPKIIIGVTILSLGTTAPETFVSVMAAFMGNPGLALGNGVGSIITNAGLIFGLTIIIAPVPLNKWILKRTGSWQLGSALLLSVFSVVAIMINTTHPYIDRWMGIVMLSLLALYLWMISYWMRSGNDPDVLNEADIVPDAENHRSSLLLTFLMLFGGLLLVIIASRLVVPAAAESARRFRVPEDVIATTMVALGTSLPELATALTAIKKGHPEITVGNIIGANVLNALFVAGMASLAAPLFISATFFTFHFPVMLLMLMSLQIFIAMNSSGKFIRWQGVYLLVLYTAYVILQYIIF